jgi:2Fe-2S ferredoxin
MAVVTYIEFGGAQHRIDVPEGRSVMQAAVGASIEGVVAECGGGLACATCHCYVDEAWIDRVGPPSETEAQMLEFTASETDPTSRLSCQIIVDDALDGLVVRLPQAQF